MPSSARSFILPFVKKEQMAEDVFSFFFRRSDVDFDFLPGQYIRMSLPHADADERGTTRFFTISSSPLEKEYLVITTKVPHKKNVFPHLSSTSSDPEFTEGMRDPESMDSRPSTMSSGPNGFRGNNKKEKKKYSSFKKTLFHLKKDDEVSFFGPMGKLFLEPSDKREKVFLAGGMGVTPFHSMLLYASANQLEIPLTLVVSAATTKNALFYQELLAIAKNNPNIKVIYTISRSGELLKKYISDIKKPHYYIVGPPGMVESTKLVLLAMGITDEQITSEDFTGYS